MTIDWNCLSDDEFGLLDEFADGFESQIKEKKRPKIEDWLNRVGEGLRPFLLHELLRIEISYSDAGKDTYISRFPDQSALVDSVFGSNESTVGDGRASDRVQQDARLSLPEDYLLKEKIGSGGMGAVYHALQTSPVKREVAVKVLRATPDSEEFIRRFEFEKQALVQMDHQFVARLFDAGLTAEGLPFFTMEYIRGLPINEYVANKNLTLHGKLKIFLRVCAAIQHAHQKGIIHRDLKPRNILVTDQDGSGVPKVIDFGLAKAFDESANIDVSRFQTGEGQLLGTINYMSPEQAKYDAVKVDTTSDIYSLGVILYELLTGTTPLTSETISEYGIIRSLGLVEKSDFPSPRQRIKNTSAEQTLEGKRVFPKSNYELDLVVMKALAADSNRRYSTVQEFADDIDNFLNCKPVLAKPDSIFYRTGKFVRRNWVATTLTLFTLMVFFAATVLLVDQRNKTSLVQAESKLKTTELEAEKTESALKTVRLEKAETEAKLLAAKAESAGILLDVFQDSLISRRRSDDRLVFSFESMLDSFFEKIQSSELLQEQRAKMFYALAIAYNSIDKPQKGLQTVRECLRIADQIYEEENLNTIKVKSILFRTLWSLGEQDEAIRILKELAKICHEVLGPYHIQTLATRSNLASAYDSYGEYDKAIKELEQVLKDQEEYLEPDNKDILITRFNLALSYSKVNRLDAAIQLLTETYRVACRNHRPEHARSIDIGKELVNLLARKKLYADAIDIQRGVIRSIKKNIGNHTDQQQVFVAQLRIGKILRDAEQYQESIEVFEEFIPKFQSTISSTDPEYYRPHANLGGAYAYIKKFDLAAKHFRLALVGLEKLLGKNANEVTEIRDYLAYILAEQLGRRVEADQLYENVK